MGKKCESDFVLYLQSELAETEIISPPDLLDVIYMEVANLSSLTYACVLLQ